MKTGGSRPHGVALLIVLGVVLTECAPAAADPIVSFIDDFGVTRTSTLIFDDSFNRTATLTSPSATAPNVPNPLDNGAAATYFIGGSIPEAGEKAQLNTALGRLETQPDLFIPLISHVFADLNTGTSGAHVLTAPTSFLVKGLFDLTVPPAVEGTYGIFLSNRDSVLNGGMGDVVQIRVRECQAGFDAYGGTTGLVLQFDYLDFVHNTFDLLGQTILDPSHQQILLELSHDGSTDTVRSHERR